MHAKSLSQVRRTIITCAIVVAIISGTSVQAQAAATTAPENYCGSGVLASFSCDLYSQGWTNVGGYGPAAVWEPPMVWFNGSGFLPYVASFGIFEPVRVTSRLQKWDAARGVWTSTFLQEVTLWQSWPAKQFAPSDCDPSFTLGTYPAVQQCGINMTGLRGYYRFSSTFEWLDWSSAAICSGCSAYGALSQSYGRPVLYTVSNVVSRWVQF